MPAVLLQMMQKSTVNFKERKLKKPADQWCWSPSFSSSLFLSSSSPTLSAVITFCSYCLCVYLCSTASVVQGVLLQSSMRPSEATSSSSSSFTSSLNNKTIVQGKPFSFPFLFCLLFYFHVCFSWKLWFLWIKTTTTTFVGVFVFIVAEVVFICHLPQTSLATLKWKSFHLLSIFCFFSSQFFISSN